MKYFEILGDYIVLREDYIDKFQRFPPPCCKQIESDYIKTIKIQLSKMFV